MVTWRHTSPLYCKSLSVYQSIPSRLSFPSWSPESIAATYWEAIMLKFLPVSGLVIFRYSASSSGVTKPSSLVSTSSNKSYELSRILFSVLSSHIMESKAVLDSGSQAAGSWFRSLCQWNLDSGSKSLAGSGFLEVYSGLRYMGRLLANNVNRQLCWSEQINR